MHLLLVAAVVAIAMAFAAEVIVLVVIKP